MRDGTGEITATWFNQPWLKDKLIPGTHVRLRGATNRAIMSLPRNAAT